MVMKPEALGRLIDEHGPALVLYARQWCDAPEDVVQEAFIKLAGQRQPPDHPAAWLYKVVRNGALTAARAARRRRHHEATAAAATPTWFAPAAPGHLDPQQVAALLHNLSLELRETIVAHLWGGLTFEQIGELTGVSSSTAHRRYLTGLIYLRERLDVPCPTNPRPTTTTRR